MIEVLDHGERRARKAHVCWHCGRPICKGTTYSFGTYKYDDVYTLKYHADCRDAAWWWFRHVDWLEDDGFPPLHDAVFEMEGQHDIDAIRGRFPHVACRLEFRRQMAQQERTA